jgi:uncharacterized protein
VSGAYLILHGWAGNWLSDQVHWQTWLADRLKTRGAVVRYPTLPDFDLPKLDAWMDVLDEELEHLPSNAVAVCHSLAATLWLHHAARRDDKRVARAVLVAPPSPDLGMTELADFFPVPLDAEGVALAATETVLVCSDDDSYFPGGAAQGVGVPLGVETIVVEGGKHLNPEAGFGPWPMIESLVVR